MAPLWRDTYFFRPSVDLQCTLISTHKSFSATLPFKRWPLQQGSNLRVWVNKHNALFTSPSQWIFFSQVRYCEVEKILLSCKGRWLWSPVSQQEKQEKKLGIGLVGVHFYASENASERQRKQPTSWGCQGNVLRSSSSLSPSMGRLERFECRPKWTEKIEGSDAG